MKARLGVELNYPEITTGLPAALIEAHRRDPGLVLAYPRRESSSPAQIAPSMLQISDFEFGISPFQLLLAVYNRVLRTVLE